ncbi:MAG: hypothetical protein J6K25_10750 [Thermoguttaceae bacterium]|nr:hypothetical protein [Thermoguttaceae bacterium]
MRYFHDSERNQWELTLNLGAAKRVYDALGVDLLNPSQESDDGRAITIRLAFDDFLLGRVVAEMIAPQAKARQLSRDELDALFDARTLAAAEKAFFAEWRDFFTQRGKTWASKAVALDYASKEVVESASLAKVELLEAERRGATSSDSPVAPESQTSAT